MNTFFLLLFNFFEVKLNGHVISSFKFSQYGTDMARGFHACVEAAWKQTPSSWCSANGLICWWIHGMKSVTWRLMWWRLMWWISSMLKLWVSVPWCLVERGLRLMKGWLCLLDRSCVEWQIGGQRQVLGNNCSLSMKETKETCLCMLELFPGFKGFRTFHRTNKFERQKLITSTSKEDYPSTGRR